MDNLEENKSKGTITEKIWKGRECRKFLSSHDMLQLGGPREKNLN